MVKSKLTALEKLNLIKAKKDKKISDLKRKALNEQKYKQRAIRERDAKEQESKSLEKLWNSEVPVTVTKYKYENNELTIGVLLDRFYKEGSNIGKIAMGYMFGKTRIRPVTENDIISICELIIKSDNTNATKKKNLGSLKRCVVNEAKFVVICTDYTKGIRCKRSMFIALTEDELHNMCKVNTINEDEEASRLIFIISCFTGQRYSDIITLQGSWRKKSDGTYMLIYNAHKTGTQAEVVGIPGFVYEYVRNLSNMDFNTRCASSNQGKMIKQIKIVAQRAGITGIEHGFFKNDKYGDFPRYELIGMHTARRTFCTRLSRIDTKIHEIAKMAGHKHIGITQGYIVGELSRDTIDKISNLNSSFM